MAAVMNIYEHFACYTAVPIRLDDVCNYITEAEFVDEFRFLGVRTDPARLPGMLHQYDITRNGTVHRIADIYYSTFIEDAG